MNRPRSARGLVSPVLALTLLAGCASPPASENSGPARGAWPQWRGPGGAGVSPLGGLPVQWAIDSGNVKWRIKPPARGTSQPIVSDGRVYLTGARGSGGSSFERTLAAFDLDDGSLLWETLISESRGERKHHRFGSRATPTPVTDGETVWAYFGSVHGKRIVAGDGKLYVTAMGSATAVVAAGREYRLLATNDLAEISESSIAIAEECLLGRAEDHLYCIGQESDAAVG